MIQLSRIPYSNLTRYTRPVHPLLRKGLGTMSPGTPPCFAWRTPSPLGKWLHTPLASPRTPQRGGLRAPASPSTSYCAPHPGLSPLSQRENTLLCPVLRTMLRTLASHPQACSAQYFIPPCPGADHSLALVQRTTHPRYPIT